MICIVGTRGSGKTAELLKFSADSGIPIAVHDSNRATSLHMLMEMLDIDAPDPVVIGNGVYGGRPSCSLAMERGKTVWLRFLLMVWNPFSALWDYVPMW